jgi:hypothetical protein
MFWNCQATIKSILPVIIFHAVPDLLAYYFAKPCHGPGIPKEPADLTVFSPLMKPY